MSALENELGRVLEAAEVAFSWQERDRGTMPNLRCDSLYGVPMIATPDFYLRESGVCIEVKGQMTLHQVTKMLFLTKTAGVPYYIYQASEEDWDPTIQARRPRRAVPRARDRASAARDRDGSPRRRTPALGPDPGARETHP